MQAFKQGRAGPAKLIAGCESYRNEIAAGASGDLAYIVALEHTTTSINGAPVQPYVLRATTVFRREGGEWKVVHRHADSLTPDVVQKLLDTPR